MNASTIVQIRLHNQQLIGTQFTTVKEIVSWMGAMQAQDYIMAKWAVGIRLPYSTDSLVEHAVNDGQIIRTHILRPTWHFVTVEDIRWMLPLSAPRVRATMGAGEKFYGFTKEITAKNNSILAKIIERNGHLTRLQIRDELNKLGITTNDNNRLAHIMMRAELDGIVCSGEIQGNKQTYCLLEERVGGLTPLNTDEALEKLARKYFTSHAPATLQDFVWWSGLTTTQARLGMELIKNDFEVIRTNEQDYWVNRSFNKFNFDSFIHLLPAFDEFIVSYRNRQHIFTQVDNKKIITSNGIFRPAITKDGEVIGRWTKTKNKNQIRFESELFAQINKEVNDRLHFASDAYLAFNK